MISPNLTRLCKENPLTIALYKWFTKPEQKEEQMDDSIPKNIMAQYEVDGTVYELIKVTTGIYDVESDGIKVQENLGSEGVVYFLANIIHNLNLVASTGSRASSGSMEVSSDVLAQIVKEAVRSEISNTKVQVSFESQSELSDYDYPMAAILFVTEYTYDEDVFDDDNDEVDFMLCWKERKWQEIDTRWPAYKSFLYTTIRDLHTISPVATNSVDADE